MSATMRLRLPIAAGLLGSFVLAGLYYAIVSVAESSEHALAQAGADRFIVGPIILGFGTQVALDAILKTRAYVPVNVPRQRAALAGASVLPVRFEGVDAPIRECQWEVLPDP